MGWKMGFEPTKYITACQAVHVKTYEIPKDLVKNKEGYFLSGIIKKRPVTASPAL